MRHVRVFIGVGSNLADPLSQVRQAFAALRAIPQTRRHVHSPLYRGEPLGPPGQPDYINAVASLETTLSAASLLTQLQAIERAQGRERGVRWGARTLDLDMLLYGDLVQASPTLTLPHPRLHERAFVLAPLRDIAPTLTIPTLGPVDELWRRCPPLRLRRLDEQ